MYKIIDQCQQVSDGLGSVLTALKKGKHVLDLVFVMYSGSHSYLSTSNNYYPVDYVLLVSRRDVRIT